MNASIGIPDRSWSKQCSLYRWAVHDVHPYPWQYQIPHRSDGPARHSRWATGQNKIRKSSSLAHVALQVREWRRRTELPRSRMILGCKGKPQELTALVTAMTFSAHDRCCGIGKTDSSCTPIGIGCASGMSWLRWTAMGDLARNYARLKKLLTASCVPS